MKINAIAAPTKIPYLHNKGSATFAKFIGNSTRNTTVVEMYHAICHKLTDVLDPFLFAPLNSATALVASGKSTPRPKPITIRQTRTAHILGAKATAAAPKVVKPRPKTKAFFCPNLLIMLSA